MNFPVTLTAISYYLAQSTYPHLSFFFFVPGGSMTVSLLIHLRTAERI